MWHKCKDGMPKKDGAYWVAKKFGKHILYDRCMFALNVGERTLDDEYDGVSGFYCLDPEWGTIVEASVAAWQEIEEYLEM